MAIEINQKVTLKDILNKVDEVSVFKTYCKPFESLNKVFCSELRDENNPSCIIKIGDNGRPYYTDFGDPDVFFDCIDYVRRKYSSDLNQVLSMINRDFALGFKMPEPKVSGVTVSTYSKPRKKKQTTLEVSVRKWNEDDTNYWYSYGISRKTLEQFNVFPIKKYKLNGYIYPADKYAYTYEFGNKVRDIYMPFSKPKMIGNSKYTHVYGLQNIRNNYNPDKMSRINLYIVSSNKEVMMLWNIKRVFAIAPQSETTPIPSNILDKMKELFRSITVIFDADRAGNKGALKMCSENELMYATPCPVLNFLGKDLTDMYKNNTLDIMDKILENETRYIRKIEKP